MELSADDTGNTVEVGSVGFSAGLPVGLRLESIEDWDVFVLKPVFLLVLVLWLGLEIEFEVIFMTSAPPFQAFLRHITSKIGIFSIISTYIVF